MKIKITKLNCKRCGHEWVPKQESIRICPKCKSPYWDVTRNNKGGKSLKKKKTLQEIIESDFRAFGRQEENIFTELCKTSLFSPAEREKMLTEPREVEKRVIFETAWGKLTVISPTLTVNDENILLAILHAAKENQSQNRYIGKISSILKYLNLELSSNEDCKRIKRSLEAMSMVSFEFIEFDEKTGEKASTTVKFMPILLEATWDIENEKLDVVVNPYFYRLYEKKLPTFFAQL